MSCAQPECGSPLGEGFKFCAACGTAVVVAPAVAEFELSPPVAKPIASVPAAALGKAVPSSAAAPRKGLRTVLLAAGAALGIVGIGLVGMGAYIKMSEAGLVGEWTTSPATPLEAKTSVWDGIKARKEAEDKAMMEKIREADGAG